RLNRRALQAWARGDYALARSFFKRLERLTRPLFSGFVGNAMVRNGRLLCLNRLAMLCREMGDPVEAERFLQEALRAARRIWLVEDEPVYADIQHNLAVLYQDRGEHARAEPLLQLVVQLRRQTLGECHPLYARSLQNLSSLYIARGDYARAEPPLQQALEIYQ